MMKPILTTIAFIALAVSGLAQTRSVIVNTSGVVQSPTNFWSADVTNARSGLGLGTAATSPASAFQPSSAVLSNLASSNGVNITNIQSSNISGSVSIANGGTGATNAGGARTALELGSAATNNASAFQPSSSVLTNLANNNGSSLTNLSAAAIVGILATNGDGAGLTNLTAANITGTVAVVNGGTGATNAAGALTNLGATTIGNALFTATNAAAAATAIGLGATNDVTFNSATLADGIAMEPAQDGDGSMTYDGVSGLKFIKPPFMAPTTNFFAFFPHWDPFSVNPLGWIMGTATNSTDDLTTLFYFASDGAFWAELGASFGGEISFRTNTAAATTRTNLGLGWSALTNTSTSGFNASAYGSGTNPVLYNTNGEVVSPTNFWQVAPIVTRFVESQPVVNQTTNITAARNLHIHSLAISTTGVTNTIALPTTNSFDGDIALVVHQGPTSSVTQVRTQGSTNNLVTMNRFEEAVEFVYYNNVWQFNHNQSFVEPIYFSGTNAAANAAASRTNLGATTVGDSVFTATNQTAAQTAIFGTNAEIRNSSGIVALSLSDGETKLVSPISFPYLNGSVAAATSRTNLGIPLAALTNTSNANFQAAIFNTNSAPTNAANVNAVNFNTAIHWMEVNVATNGVTNNFRIPLFK